MTRFTIASAVAVLTLAACKEAAPPETVDDPLAAPETVEDSLTRLGVDLTETPRVDDNGDALPDDYAPIGSQARLNVTSEIVLVGASLAGSPSRMTLLEAEAGAEDVLLSDDTVPWAAVAGQTRAITAADVDGDGLQETVVAYRDANDITWLQAMQDEEEGFALGERLELSRDDVRDVAVTAGDFDGDGVDEVVVGLVLPEGATLVRAGADGSRFRALEGPGEVAVASGGWLELAAGNLDHDASHELVVLVNRGDGSPARWSVRDDAPRAFAVLVEDAVSSVTDEASSTSVVAGLAVGDVDADGRDEVVLGGLANPDVGCEAYEHLVMVVDDAVGEFVTVDAAIFDHHVEECAAYSPARLGGVHVHALDVDGEGGMEIAVNQFVFDGGLQLLHQVPDDEFLYRPNYPSRFNRGTSASAVGDVTGDGRDDLLMLSDTTGRGLQVWGVHPIDGWSLQHEIPVDSANGADLVAVDVDVDGLVLSYDEGTYQLVFTEPVILAALAAPPCNDAIDQNLEACRTSWGQSESSTMGADGTLSVHASVYSGFGASDSFFGIEFGAEVTKTVTATASFSAGYAYETTKTVSYTTGPLEDSVVFTSIPYDQWTYTITSHPEPELIGEEIVVSIPREPVTLMVERTFFNDSVVDGSTRVVEDVLGHVPGDPASYHTPASRDALLASYGGIASNPVTVGQGAGETEVSVDFSEETSYRAGVEIDYTYDVKTTTAGVIAGFSVGGGVEAGLSWGTGTATHYTGTVGQIAGDDFGDHYYTYGLFTYPVAANGQQFEVIDYWVE